MAALRNAASSSSFLTQARTPRIRTKVILGAVLPLLSAGTARATLYWDVNGTTANGTVTTATSTWTSSSLNWNTDPSGTGGTATSWTAAGDTAVFSSGTNFTGGSTVTVSGPQNITGITFEEGTITLGGTTGSLNIGTNNVLIQTTHSGTQSIQIPITGSGDLTFSNTSGADITFNVDSQMSGFTGNIVVGAGTSATLLTKLQLDTAPGDSTKTITLNSFSELSNNNPNTFSGFITPTSYAINNPIVLAGSDAWLASANGLTGVQKIVTYGGTISGSGNLWIGINNSGGRGTVVLGTATTPQYTYAGNTYITLVNTNGLVQLGADNILPSATNLVFGPATSGTAAIAPFDFNGHSLTVASLASNTTSATSSLYNLNSNPVILTINQNTNTTFRGQIGATNLAVNPFNDNAPYLNNTTAYTNISLTKNGTGTLVLTSGANNISNLSVTAGTITLSGAGNFAANASVTGGTLSVTNSSNVNTGLTVNSGNLSVTGTSATSTGTIASGTGVSTGSTITGSITVGQYGVVSPGNAGNIGLLAVTQSLNFNDGSALNLDWLNSSSIDNLNVTGALNFDSGVHTLNLSLATGASPIVAGTYHIAVAGSINGSNLFTMGNTPGGNFSYNVGIDPSFSTLLDLVITPTSPVYRWDNNAGGSANGISEGDGTWNIGSTNFTDLSTGNEATWDNTTPVDVVIGGDTFNSGGTIALGDNIIVNGKLTFSPVLQGAPYTLGADNSHSITLGTAGMTSGVEADTNATINAPVVLAGSQTWTVNGSANLLSVTQPITGSGTLTKTGSGLLIFGASGGAIDGLTVTGGAVLIQQPDAIGATTPVSLDTNGEFGLDASITSTNPVTVGAGGGQLVVSGGNTGTMAGNITSTSGGVLTKNGAGVLALAGTNTITSLTIAGGTGSFLQVNDPAQLGGATVTLNNGGLRLSAPMTVANNFVWTATGTNGLNDIVDTAGNDVTMTGTASGAGDWHKVGGGTLTLALNSTAKGGAFYLDDSSTIIATTVNAFGLATIAVNTNGTFDIETANVNAAYMRGDATTSNVSVHKTGTGNLTLAAPGSNVPGSAKTGTSISIDAGSITLGASNGLGGATSADMMNVTINPNTSLIANYGNATGSGERVGGNLILAGGSIIRAAAAPAGDSNVLQSMTQTTTAGVITSVDHGNSLNVTANSTIEAQPISTSNALSILSFSGPVNINSGATLTVKNDNTGGYDDQNYISFRGTIDGTTGANSTHANIAFPNVDFVIQAGATLNIQGPGRVAFGKNSSSQSIPVVGQGTPGNESTIKFSPNTFMEDLSATNQYATRWVVSGSGNAGLRLEAPMNASYTDRSIDSDPTHPDGVTGLLGTNTTGTNGAAVGAFPRIGSAYTVMSALRWDRLGNLTDTPIRTISGTVTLAATDPAGATGVIDAGPSLVPSTTAGPSLALAVDNTSTSGNLIYQFDGQASTGSKLMNFVNGVTIERSFTSAGTVLGQLKSNTHLTSLTLLNSTSFDLVDKALAVESNANISSYLTSGNIYSSTVNADTHHISTIAQVLGTDLGLTGTATVTLGGMTIDASSLILKPTYYGDINLDGHIDADDYALMDRSVAKGLTPNWVDGDFNNDGVVNQTDYGLLDTSYVVSNGGTFDPGFLDAREARFGDAYVQSLIASVPEPTSLALLGMALPLIARRRRSAR